MILYLFLLFIKSLPPPLVITMQLPILIPPRDVGEGGRSGIDFSATGKQCLF